MILSSSCCMSPFHLHDRFFFLIFRIHTYSTDRKNQKCTNKSFMVAFQRLHVAEMLLKKNRKKFCRADGKSCGVKMTNPVHFLHHDPPFYMSTAPAERNAWYAQKGIHIASSTCSRPNYNVFGFAKTLRKEVCTQDKLAHQCIFEHFRKAY